MLSVSGAVVLMYGTLSFFLWPGESFVSLSVCIRRGVCPYFVGYSGSRVMVSFSSGSVLL